MKSLILTILVLIFSINFSYSQNTQNISDTEDQPKGLLYAYAWFDYFYKIGGDTLNWGKGEFSKEPRDANAFTFRRVYLGYDHQISDNVVGKILLEGHDKSTISTGDRGVFIKSMHVQLNGLVPNSSIYIGQFLTPSWSYSSEPIWGYRSIEKTVTDFHGLGNSNDLGLMLMGNFDRAGLFGYSLMVGNGTGTKAENNKYKKFYGFLNAKPLDKKMHIEVYGDFQQIDPVRSTYTMKFLTAYKSDNFSIGVDAVRQVQQKFYTADDSDIIPLGVSLFAHGTLVDNKLRAFGRVDYFNPDMDFTNSRVYANDENYYDQIFVTAGLDWSPLKNFKIQPNFWLNFYQDKRDVKVDRKADVVGRLTFVYSFSNPLF